jgi:transcriptional regulator with GAF, ATPase, and Fis domain
VEVVLLDHENDGASSAPAQRAEPLPQTQEPVLPGNHGQDDGGKTDNCRREVPPDGDCGQKEVVTRSCSQLACLNPCETPSAPSAPPTRAALPGMIGDSQAMQPVYHMAVLVAPRDTTVLITGPTGSGKELVARALHQLSPRAARTFAVVNCAAIPETLIEAELFGYTRGAFTGALQSYAGRVQTAHLGTLFLDEIGDMPLSLQPKLLRFLEQKELQRLGSSQVVRVDARVVAATNVDLVALVGQGRFREDLYYRLAAFPLDIPPLSERPGDVVQLAEHFLEKLSPRPPAPVLSDEAAALLQKRSWPGNVRELQNAMERALILANGENVIRPAHLMLTDTGSRPRPSADWTLSSPAAIRAF